MQQSLILILSLLLSACSLNQKRLTSSPVFNKNPLLTTTGKAHYLNWDRALTASILLNKDYSFNQHIDAYTALYHPDIVNFYNNDDALLALKKIKLRRHWKMSNEQQRGQLLRLQTEVNLGAYDRQLQAFPIKAIKLRNEQQNYQYKLTKTLPKESSFPPYFYIYISNITQLKQLKLEPVLARLVTSNNIQRGHINSLPIDIEININQVAGQQGEGLGAIMTRVIFYSDIGREVPLRIDLFSVVDNE
ncbi:DUF4852 domain-containing protein [Moritella viscosa]|uniref:Threonine dehydratase n=1 Tax=Moritella viscosa TaxID=80854 RepID=A0A1K9ZXU0_9GAMM|nr:DUF4852 domain-containing protein [Moritella viscosa]SGY93046.1 Threonine dehydratase [Moritella viscosa]SGZ03877.1 Threonine dehydratase [Moritella viscosa]SGZ04261.1 Threonine dehydratase [Moritella viscosa]SHO07860.1 Threonine dehydratase [Moritella viscosa]SHO07902.1 Threonine dehydratase [Moritella viscosa]